MPFLWMGPPPGREGGKTRSFESLTMHPLLAEKLWIGLENFVFDWLINADR